MIERLIAALIVSGAIVLSALLVGASSSNADVATSIDSLTRKLASVDSTLSSLRSTTNHSQGLSGEAGGIVIEYVDGGTVQMSAGEDDYSDYKAFYIHVADNHIVIHLVKPGEASNSGAVRKLIPFAAVRSMKRIP